LVVFSIFVPLAARREPVCWSLRTARAPSRDNNDGRYFERLVRSSFSYILRNGLQF
jgi:hypothetical protein